MDVCACSRLFRVENTYAYYDSDHKHVVIVADLWTNPYTDHVCICPNPIAMPPTALEFLVEGTTHSGGIHPDMQVKHRVVYSFASDVTPRSVVLYTMGTDSPSRHEISVGSSPPPPLLPGARGVAAPAPAKQRPSGMPVEVTGYSARFSFDEALQDAVAKAAALFPSPP